MYFRVGLLLSSSSGESNTKMSLTVHMSDWSFKRNLHGLILGGPVIGLLSVSQKAYRLSMYLWPLYIQPVVQHSVSQHYESKIMSVVTADVI